MKNTSIVDSSKALLFGAVFVFGGCIGADVCSCPDVPDSVYYPISERAYQAEFSQTSSSSSDVQPIESGFPRDVTYSSTPILEVDKEHKIVMVRYSIGITEVVTARNWDGSVKESHTRPVTEVVETWEITDLKERVSVY